MTRIEAESLLAEFKASSSLQLRMAAILDQFAAICAANALVRGFHDDEEHLRNAAEHGLFEEGGTFEMEAPVGQAWIDEHLAWFDAQILQAELGRQASEIGEAIEAVRKPGPDHHCPEFSNFLIEEADVLIRVGDTCAKRGLPLGQAVVAKLLANLNRPLKHGKNS